MWIEPNGAEAPIVPTSATQVTIADRYSDRVIIHDVREELAGMPGTPCEYFAATHEDVICILGGAPHELTPKERKGWENDRGVAKTLRRISYLAVRRLNTDQLRHIQECAVGLVAGRQGEALERQHSFGASRGNRKVDTAWARCLGDSRTTTNLRLRRVGGYRLRHVGANPRRSERHNTPVPPLEHPTVESTTRGSMEESSIVLTSESESSDNEGSVEL